MARTFGVFLQSHLFHMKSIFKDKDVDLTELHMFADIELYFERCCCWDRKSVVGRYIGSPEASDIFKT